MKAVVSEMVKTWDDVIKEFEDDIRKRDIFFETYEEAGE